MAVYHLALTEGARRLGLYVNERLVLEGPEVSPEEVLQAVADRGPVDEHFTLSIPEASLEAHGGVFPSDLTQIADPWRYRA